MARFYPYLVELKLAKVLKDFDDLIEFYPYLVELKLSTWRLRFIEKGRAKTPL